ncbi:hypothetical protein SAY87_022584 [Trapa incisa]|uniref:Uncharacterized protein n=1 Tax=Trapa incisa TaxID=236973 RepID=A0AAN7Q4X0_9MYRT|nr:hypothetical protein SAY87_022584 [Trapa incisa]
MGRAPCCDKASVRKGPWSPGEDATLKSYIEEHGPVGNWIALPQKIGEFCKSIHMHVHVHNRVWFVVCGDVFQASYSSGLKRCGKSCRLRWLNYLRPNIKHGGFSEEEDRIICGLYISIGSRWSIIAAQLPGRTDNDIKNYWNTKLKKKLLGKQRNKECHVRKDRSKRGLTKAAASRNEDFSVIWETGGDWYGLATEVNHMPPASINQSPNPNSHQTSLTEYQLRGRLASNSNQLEQEPAPIEADFLHYPNHMVPPNCYNPIERSTVVSCLRPLGLSNGLMSTRYSLSNEDNINIPVFAENNTLPQISTGEVDRRDLQSHLFEYSRYVGNIYSAHEAMDRSMCSSGALSHGRGSGNVWEDIISSTSQLLDENYGGHEAVSSQWVGGGRGTGGSSFGKSGGGAWDT